MRKFFAAILCGALLLSSSLSLAAVDAGKIALGPVYPSMSTNDLLNACGQPNYRDGDDWIYSSFKVDIEHGIVEKVETYSGGLATPAGVSVGQAAEALNSTYGSADSIDYDDGGIEYEYFSNDGSKKIEFKVFNGVISKITCKFRD